MFEKRSRLMYNDIWFTVFEERSLLMYNDIWFTVFEKLSLLMYRNIMCNLRSHHLRSIYRVLRHLRKVAKNLQVMLPHSHRIQILFYIIVYLSIHKY